MTSTHIILLGGAIGAAWGAVLYLLGALEGASVGAAWCAGSACAVVGIAVATLSFGGNNQ